MEARSMMEARSLMDDVVCTKITIVKRKTLPKDQQPVESHEVPLHKRLVLTTQALTEISDLRELYAGL